MKVSPSEVWRNKEILYSLTALKCRDCGYLYFPFQKLCPNCKSSNVEKVNLNTEGRLVTYTVNYQLRDGYEKVMPQYIGLIEFENGLRIIAPLTDVEGEEIKEGAKVRATLRRLRTDSSTGIIIYGIKFKIDEND
ncbi:MAG: Zn-ribbon domain-containing OB-fold protein [Sulfolobaceae archaeon]